jgi:hypothetical protein
MPFINMEHGFLIRGNMELESTQEASRKALTQIHSYLKKHHEMNNKDFLHNASGSQANQQQSAPSPSYSPTFQGVSSSANKQQSTPAPSYSPTFQGVSSSPNKQKSAPPPSYSPNFQGVSPSITPGIDATKPLQDRPPQAGRPILSKESSQDLSGINAVTQKASPSIPSTPSQSSSVIDVMKPRQQQQSGGVAAETMEKGSNMASSIGDTIKDKAKGVMSGVGNLAEKAKESLFSAKDNVMGSSNTKQSLKDGYGEAKDKIHQGATFAGEKLKEKGQNLKGGVASLKDSTFAAVDSAKDQAKNAVSSAKVGATFAGDQMKGKGSNPQMQDRINSTFAAVHSGKPAGSTSTGRPSAASINMKDPSLSALDSLEGKAGESSSTAANIPVEREFFDHSIPQKNVDGGNGAINMKPFIREQVGANDVMKIGIEHIEGSVDAAKKAERVAAEKIAAEMKQAAKTDLDARLHDLSSASSIPANHSSGSVGSWPVKPTPYASNTKANNDLNVTEFTNALSEGEGKENLFEKDEPVNKRGQTFAGVMRDAKEEYAGIQEATINQVYEDELKKAKK